VTGRKARLGSPGGLATARGGRLAGGPGWGSRGGSVVGTPEGWNPARVCVPPEATAAGHPGWALSRERMGLDRDLTPR